MCDLRIHWDIQYEVTQWDINSQLEDIKLQKIGIGRKKQLSRAAQLTVKRFKITLQ